jgi:phosphatidylserine/phosphatidylglycerophosphate/cardiolipin synthase-like enzyme
MVAAVAVLLAAPAVAADRESIEELVERIGRARWTHDNRVELLADPRRSWDARVEMAEDAHHHILISTFSWHNDDYGKAYRQILKEAVETRRSEGIGLTVRVLADASALGLFNTAFSALEKQGAKVRGFNRSSYGLSALFDGRMHDKTIIVDGRSAIVSGRNFADLYFDPERWWLDLGVRIEGSAVDDIQMNFFKSWELTSVNRHPGSFFLPQEMLLENLRVFWRTGRYPSGRSPLEHYMTPEFFPPRGSSSGGTSVAFLYDNPLLRRRAASTDLLVALIDQAVARVDLMTPFPNLTTDLTDALASAAGRGVAVRLFVNDREAAIRGGPFLLAGYPTLIQLIEADAEVWAWRANKKMLREIEQSECQPSLLPPVAIHGKMLRVDDELSVIHSSNFNYRSTYYNTEAGVVVLDRGFARALDELLDGLIHLEDFQLDCINGVDGPNSSAVLRRLGPDEIPEMKQELGKKQKFLDSMSVAW